MAVCVGAMMVGSIQTTVEEGENVARGQEFGYFAFGGYTLTPSRLMQCFTLLTEWQVAPPL